MDRRSRCVYVQASPAARSGSSLVPGRRRSPERTPTRLSRCERPKTKGAEYGSVAEACRRVARDALLQRDDRRRRRAGCVCGRRRTPPRGRSRRNQQRKARRSKRKEQRRKRRNPRKKPRTRRTRSRTEQRTPRTRERTPGGADQKDRRKERQ